MTQAPTEMGTLTRHFKVGHLGAPSAGSRSSCRARETTSETIEESIYGPRAWVGPSSGPLAARPGRRAGKMSPQARIPLRHEALGVPLPTQARLAGAHSARLPRPAHPRAKA